MKGCTVVSFMEEKLSIFRNILTFYVDVDTAAQSLGETISIFSEGHSVDIVEEEHFRITNDPRITFIFLIQFFLNKNF